MQVVQPPALRITSPIPRMLPYHLTHPRHKNFEKRRQLRRSFYVHKSNKTSTRHFLETGIAGSYHLRLTLPPPYTASSVRPLTVSYAAHHTTHRLKLPSTRLDTPPPHRFSRLLQTFPSTSLSLLPHAPLPHDSTDLFLSFPSSSLHFTMTAPLLSTPYNIRHFPH